MVCLESNLVYSDSSQRKIGSVSKSAFPVAVASIHVPLQRHPLNRREQFCRKQAVLKLD